MATIMNITGRIVPATLTTMQAIDETASVVARMKRALEVQPKSDARAIGLALCMKTEALISLLRVVTEAQAFVATAPPASQAALARTNTARDPESTSSLESRLLR